MAVLRPFDETGIAPDAAGVRRYTELPGSVTEALRAIVDRHPDHEALVELGGPRLTYAQLWDAAAKVAGGLRANGVSRGDRVAIRHGNGVDWVLAFLGAQLAGAVAVPVNTRLAPAEVDYLVGDSGAKVLLAPGEPLPTGDPYAAEGLDRTDLAAIFYTSGTTGFPKGARTLQENFLTNAVNAQRVSKIPVEDDSIRVQISVPLFHVTGCNSQLVTGLISGWTLVIMPTFDVGEFLRSIPAERITGLTTVPAIYWYAFSRPDLADFDLSTVTYASYGGAPIAPSLVRRIKQVLPHAHVGNGFGLTETAAMSTYLPDEYALSHADSVGFAAPTIDLDLAHRDGEGVGELLIRGGNVVDGYWGKPEATAEAFVNGWLHTGDLARIDPDGRVYIVDRVKDMINRGGENVYSVEVENVLAAAPGVFEVAVVGVADDMMGEKVGAVLVPTPDQPFDTDAVLAYARERLADFKVPQYVHVQAVPLPRNPGGKVLKTSMRGDAIEWTPTKR